MPLNVVSGRPSLRSSRAWIASTFSPFRPCGNTGRGASRRCSRGYANRLRHFAAARYSTRSWLAQPGSCLSKDGRKNFQMACGCDGFDFWELEQRTGEVVKGRSRLAQSSRNLLQSWKLVFFLPADYDSLTMTRRVRGCVTPSETWARERRIYLIIVRIAMQRGILVNFCQPTTNAVEALGDTENT